MNVGGVFVPPSATIVPILHSHICCCQTHTGILKVNITCRRRGEHLNYIYIEDFFLFLFLCTLLSVIKQFQFSIGSIMESKIVWQKVLRTTALTLNNYTCLTRKGNGENTLCPAPNADKDRKQLKQGRTKTEVQR